MNQNIEIIPTSIPEETSRTSSSHDSIFNVTSIYSILINPTHRADIIINTSPRQIILAVIQSIKKLNNLLTIRRVLLICINKFIPIGITNR